MALDRGPGATSEVYTGDPHKPIEGRSSGQGFFDVIAFEAWISPVELVAGFGTGRTTGLFLLDTSSLTTVLVWEGEELPVLQCEFLPG